MNKEMREVIYAMMEEDNYEPEEACARCPYAGICERHQLQYGCAIWEDMMGEDL